MKWKTMLAVMSIVASESHAHGIVIDRSLIEQGRQVASVHSCDGCHGSKGDSKYQSYPNLAGQKYRYMVHELKGYADGSRIDDILTEYPEREDMGAIAASLTEHEIRAVSSYYASLGHKHKLSRHFIYEFGAASPSPK